MYKYVVIVALDVDRVLSAHDGCDLSIASALRKETNVSPLQKCVLTFL